MAFSTPPDPNPTWAVIVVHGVGESSPGTTLESFVPTLASRKKGALQEVRRCEWVLEEPPDALPPKPPPLRPPGATGRTFRAQYREINVVNPPPGTPDQAVFAELYWADLSSAGERLRDLVLRVFTVLFQLRHLAHSAASLPGLRWPPYLRWLLYLGSWLLCGPITAFNVFALYVLVARAVARLVVPHVPWAVPAGQLDGGMAVLGGVGALLGAAGWFRLRNDRNWDGVWAQIAAWFGLTGLAVASLALYRLAVPPEVFWGHGPGKWVARHLHLQTDRTGTSATYLAFLICATHVTFVALGAVLLAAAAVWLLAVREARASGRAAALPALAAALGSFCLQLGLWVILVPALAWALLAATEVGGLREAVSEPVFDPVRTRFALHLLLAVLVGGYAFVVLLLRLRWVRGHPGPYAGVAQAGGIPRLVINRGLLVLVIGFSVLGSAFFVYSFFAGSAWFDRFLGGVSAYVAGGVAVLLTAAVHRRRGVGAWLHIITDITNHFWRPRLPWPGLKVGRFDPSDLPIQQRIEARFRRLLWHLRQSYNVTHLTVVSHSQGTVIAADVLWLEWSHHVLQGVDVRLITMGSPLTHLYQHYFPDRYQPFFLRAVPVPLFNKGAWGQLPATVGRWVNIYRVDDFIGTHIDGDAGNQFPVNTWLPRPGGHTGYWSDADAVAVMAPDLPG